MCCGVYRSTQEPTGASVHSCDNGAREAAFGWALKNIPFPGSNSPMTPTLSRPGRVTRSRPLKLKTQSAGTGSSFETSARVPGSNLSMDGDE